MRGDRRCKGLADLRHKSYAGKAKKKWEIKIAKLF